MGTYYCGPSVPAGTGAGTLADPWNINDVLTAANPKGLGAGDLVGLLTGGTHSATTQLGTFASGGNSPIIFAADPSDGSLARGALAVIDGAGLGGTETGLTIGHYYNIVIGIKVQNFPSVGFYLNASGDYSMVIGCEADANAGNGFEVAVNCPYAVLAYCRAVNNSGVYGISHQHYANPGLIYRCYSDGTIYHSGRPTWIIDCLTEKNIVIGRSPAFADGLVARALGTRGQNGIKVGQSTANQVVLNTIMSFYDIGMSQQGTQPPALTAGNVYHDCTSARDFTPLLDGDSPIDTTDPAFVSSTDWTPTADLSGRATPLEAIHQEAPWIIPGAIQPGGGGGGGISRARLVNAGGV